MEEHICNFKLHNQSTRVPEYQSARVPECQSVKIIIYLINIIRLIHDIRVELDNTILDERYLVKT